MQLIQGSLPLLVSGQIFYLSFFHCLLWTIEVQHMYITEKLLMYVIFYLGSFYIDDLCIYGGRFLMCWTPKISSFVGGEEIHHIADLHTIIKQEHISSINFYPLHNNLAFFLRLAHKVNKTLQLLYIFTTI